jgi:phage gp29-like protein
MPLLDQYGRPIDMAVLKQEQGGPTVASVRRPRVYDQAAGLTPGRLARLMKQATLGDPEGYLALAEDMEERDLHYAGVLAIRKRQVASLEITVKPAGEDAESLKDAELARQVVERDEFETELVDILDAIGKGFSGTEILWDTSEGQWMPEALKWRDPTWFTFDLTDGETPYLRDSAAPMPLAPYKWIFHTAKVKSGLPIRGGIARSVAWTFLFKAFTAKDWAIFCEAYGQPLRLGKYGEGASEPDKDILLEAVTNIGADYSAIVPESMSIEFVKADVAGSHELYEKRADWLDRQVSKLVLGQTGTTDAIAGGYAVGKIHDGVRADIERSDAKQLSASVNRDLVRPLIDLNHGPRKRYPKVRIGRPDEVDIDKLTSNIVKMVPFGLRVGVSTVYNKLGIVDPKPGEEILRPAAQPAATETKDEPLVPPAAKTSAQRASALPTDAIDDAVASISDDGWEEMVTPMIDGLEAKIAAAGSADEARQILADHFRTMGTDTMAELLARLMFAARLAGEADEPLSEKG